MADRAEVRQRMLDDDIEYLLVQFVDINGSPKVKMVPAIHLGRRHRYRSGVRRGRLAGHGPGPPTPTTCWPESIWTPTHRFHGPAG